MDLGRNDEKESTLGFIQSIVGPIVVANNLYGIEMNEMVKIGDKGIPGEVIRIEGDNAIIQVYSSTVGMGRGESVSRTFKPLSVELGPGLLEHIFDGIQNPLIQLYEGTKSIYMPKAIEIPPLNRDKQWHFDPMMKIGDLIVGGDVYGKVVENDLFVHSIMLPPGKMGTITFIAPVDNYTLQDFVLEVEFREKKEKFYMVHTWPIRTPRPYSEKLSLDEPFSLGMRAFDALFPLVHGGTCSIPASPGCGARTTSYMSQKNPDIDCNIYIGCGCRDALMAETIMEMPVVQVNNGQSLMKKSSIIANTTSMSVAGREASIYTGIIMAEYIRDMGLKVLVTVDDFSRWSEAIREISSLLKELPGERGFPSYTRSRITSYYERAGTYECLGSPKRNGSITILGMISPEGGDLSDPIMSVALENTQTFWALDRKMAQRRRFPEINPLLSYSHYAQKLAPFYENFKADYMECRSKALEIINREAELEELVQTLGKGALPDREQLSLMVFMMMRDDFCNQNLFSSWDKYCPMYKSYWMLKIITTFRELSEDLLDRNIPFSGINENTEEERREIQRMKLRDHNELGQVALEMNYSNLLEQIQDKFFEMRTDAQ